MEIFFAVEGVNHKINDSAVLKYLLSTGKVDHEHLNDGGQTLKEFSTAYNSNLVTLF